MNTAPSLVAKPPSPILRALLRLPILLYRMHLGALLDGRFVMIDHVGRKSGTPYQTVVEVVGHDRAGETYYVASGWGKKSSWYQNLMAHPQTTIHVGRRVLNVRAETLPPAEAARVLITYRQEHRFSARELSSIMGIDIAGAAPAELERITAEHVPVVAFRPTRSDKSS